jgi:hypothetical protein
MPANKPCPPGCGCWKHSRPRMSPEEQKQRRRESEARWRKENPGKVREKNARYYRENREKENARSADYYQDNAETVAVRRSAYRQANPELVREQNARYYVDNDRRMKTLLWKHSMLPEDFARLWEGQRGCCYLCGDELSRVSKQVHIDHDHSCCPPHRSCARCRRGLACQACNAAIGYAKDDPDRMERIATSLRHAKAAARDRINGKPVQEELPINVARLEPRRKESA